MTMSEHTPEAPSSEEVSLALRRCWQPVARVEDLRDGPQRAVLLGEALAVFLTESGEPAVVATAAPTAAPRSRWARSGARASSAPTTAGSGRRRRRLHPDPLAGRPGADPAARADPGLPGARAVGAGLDGAGGAARRAADVPGSTPDAWTLGARDAVRAAGGPRGDDRELPRRRPLRLRPRGDPRRDRRRWSSRSSPSATGSR